MSDNQDEVFLGHHNDKYKKSKLKVITPIFAVESAQDRIILDFLFQLSSQKRIQGMDVNGLLKSTQDFASMVEFRTNGIKRVKVKVDKSVEGSDAADVFLNVEK